LENQLYKKRLFLKQIQGAYKVFEAKNYFLPQKYMLQQTDSKLYKKKAKLKKKKFFEMVLKKFQRDQQNVFFSSAMPQKIWL
jgi:hypothetical protein